MYDLLLAKHGIATPVRYPLRVAVTRHQARLHAELTKARLRRGFSSIAELRQQLNQLASSAGHLRHETTIVGNANVQGSALQHWDHPRWVRINTLRTRLDVELKTTFLNYTRLDSLEKILDGSGDQNLYYVDKHIPDLLALPPNSDIQKSPAYRDGLVILQDKASCFPAYLLDPKLGEGDVVDACAAPGNKSTHLAALLQSQKSTQPECRIWACELDTARALTLKSMIEKTGAHAIVRIKPGQDFLQIDPHRLPWSQVHYLLLDPSCSGSGIVGRDDISIIALPSTKSVHEQQRTHRSAKRKRSSKAEFFSAPNDLKDKNQNAPEACNDATHMARLSALSAFQLRLLQHAFSFPAARKITYSTCSLDALENEHVVLKGLASSVAVHRGWRILQREEQVAGARSWPLRGDGDACCDVNLTDSGGASLNNDARAVVAEACIRCEKGTREGTQGFFVAGFVRDESSDRAKLGGMEFRGANKDLRVKEGPTEEGRDSISDSEWEGFGGE